MEDIEEPAVVPMAHRPAPHLRGRRWFLPWGVALAWVLTLGSGALLATTLGPNQARAESVVSGGAAHSQLRTPVPGTGQCGGNLTVTHVTGRTITVTREDGSTATIHVTNRTRYTRYGQAVTASAIVVGSRLYVVGTCTGQGGRTINATSIEIVS